MTSPTKTPQIDAKSPVNPFKAAWNGVKAIFNLKQAREAREAGNSEVEKEKALDAVGNLLSILPGSSRDGVNGIKNNLHRIIKTPEQRDRDIERIEKGEPVSFNQQNIGEKESLLASVNDSPVLRQNLHAANKPRAEEVSIAVNGSDIVPKGFSVSGNSVGYQMLAANAVKPAENQPTAELKEEAAPNTPSDDFGMA